MDKLDIAIETYEYALLRYEGQRNGHEDPRLEKKITIVKQWIADSKAQKLKQIPVVCYQVAEYFNLTFSELIQQNRKDPQRTARQLCAWLLDKHGYGASESGRILGLNHATMGHAVKRINNLIDIKDREILNAIKNLL